MAEAVPETEVVIAPLPRRRWWAYALGAVAGLLALAVLAVVVLDSAIGRRLIADQLNGLSTTSGLSITVGRLDGSIFTRATLQNVTLRDPQGVFAKAPAVTLDWHPLGWLSGSLDIRALTVRRATLLRLPKLRPGDPNAPLLPDFDIRIDRLALERVTVARGILGSERRLDLHASVDIRKNRAFLAVAGALSGGDRLAALLDADRTRNRFALGGDVAAPKGGLIAALTGAQQDRRLRVGGRGDWHDWRGGLLAEGAGKRIAALRLTQRDGAFGVAGQIDARGLTNATTAHTLGDIVAVTGTGRLVDHVLTGHIGIASRALRAGAIGAADLRGNALRQVSATVDPLDPAILGPGTQLRDGHLHLIANGPFASPAIDTTLTAASLISGTTRLDGIAAHGVTTRFTTGIANAWRLPLALTTRAIVTGNASVDPLLTAVHGTATLTLANGVVASDDIALVSRGATARLTLRRPLATDHATVTGHVAARGIALPTTGLADADAAVALAVVGNDWDLTSQVSGRLTRIDNATVASFAGGALRFTGAVAASADGPIRILHATLTGPDATVAVAGLIRADSTADLTGSGHHVTYGPFDFAAHIASDGPHATITLADPVPAAGVRNVRLVIAPAAGGLAIEANGTSTLGDFNGNLALHTPPNAPARVDFDHFDIWKTSVAGSLTFAPAGVDGGLVLAGGGVNGTIKLAPKAGGEEIAARLAATDAHFGGANPLTIGNAKVEANGLIAHGHTTLTADGSAQGIGKGSLFIGRLAARAKIVDGHGQITAALGGRRGSRFDLQVLGDIVPDRVAVIANGTFAGQRIIMPRRAVFTNAGQGEGGGWHLAATEVDFGGGRVIGSGVVGNSSKLDLALADMPLSLANVIFTDVGLGGSASGTFTFLAPRDALPTGEARLLLKGLTRSGLALTSRPIDVALVGQLGTEALEMRTVLSEAGQLRGRLQARIAALPATGTLPDRLRAGRLEAQMRYSGPADALWRLVSIETFDLTGPLALAADITGTLDDPVIHGSLASDALRLQSALTGTDISAIRARGSFTGSRLVLSDLAGKTGGNGDIAGSGFIDFSGIDAGHGAGLDLKLGARKAQLLARPEIALTATGPVRILSDGVSGTIAARLAIDNARWRLGQASAAAQLPHIPTREINRSADIAPASAREVPFRYLIDAAGPGRIFVQGQGLDSEWNSRLKLRGTIDDPAITGEATMLEGTYDFAGKRFQLTRGRVSFDGASPPDPRLDVAATADVTGLTATVTVTGSALTPQIAFTSVPALPEEELLSRLLFGASITSISAPEALQLGAALAALHGGGGLDPVNKVRSAIGLDRLRIVAADSTIGMQTGVAAGKYIGRHLYAEVVSDGRGYSATNLEFRVTSWLSLLATVSTVGRQSVNAKVSHDY